MILFRDRYEYDPEKDDIGEGAFAQVFKAYDTTLKTHVALKFYRGQANNKYDIIGEIRRMIDLAHPNLAKYYAIEIEKRTNTAGKKVEVQVGIIKYANGREHLKYGSDLKAFLKEYSYKTHPKLFEKIINDILRGLQYLHQNKIVHRDLKPANILMHYENEEWTALIADFGLSKQTDTAQSSSRGYKGTPAYTAPEQIMPQKYGINGKLNTNADLWAFGAILYEIFTGKSPYNMQANEGGLLEKLIAEADNFTPGKLALNNIPPPYKTWISRCLVQDANKRTKSVEELMANKTDNSKQHKTYIEPKPTEEPNIFVQKLNEDHPPSPSNDGIKWW